MILELFPEPADDSADDAGGGGPVLQRRLGPRTPCVDCGHKQRDHHLHPESHWADGDWPYYCVTAHCVARFWRGSETEQCNCQYFRATPAAVPQFTRPAVDAYTRCLGCGHWRCMHCSQHRLKQGQSPTHSVWKGFVDADGQIQPCSHTLPNAQPYACDSTACATVLGEGENEHYCHCPTFVSPFLKKKAAKAPTTKRKSKKDAFVTGQGAFPFVAEVTAESDVNP